MCPFKKAFPCALLLHLLFFVGIFGAYAAHRDEATFTLAPAVGDGEGMTLSVVRVGEPEDVAPSKPESDKVAGLEPAPSDASMEPVKPSAQSEIVQCPVQQRIPATSSGVAGTPGQDERLGGAAAGNAGGEITPPVVISRSKPQRPEEIAGGRVEVYFTIDENGCVQNPRITASSSPYLSAAVLKILPQWRFVPAKKDGDPIALNVRQVVEF